MMTILGALILALLVLPSLAACEADRSIRTAEEPAIERDPAASVWSHEAYPVEVCEWISPVTLTWPHIGLVIQARAAGIAEQEDPEARATLGVGALWLGATKDQACLGWGKPINVISRGAAKEHWIYPRGRYLFFTGDGRLVDTLERVQSATMEQRLIDKETSLAALKVLRNTLKEKAATTVDRSRPLDLDLDDDPVAEYILFEGERRVPKDKVELVRRGRAHIAAEIRRVIERVEVEKGQPVKVILKG